MADLKKLAETLTGLTVLEVNELKTILKDEYGIEPAAAAVAVAGPAADELAAIVVVAGNTAGPGCVAELHRRGLHRRGLTEIAVGEQVGNRCCVGKAYRADRQCHRHAQG